MTYCVGLRLDRGIVFASDTRTNAGLDNVATFSKMHVWERKGDRVLVLMSAGQPRLHAVDRFSLLNEKIDAIDGPDGSAASLTNVSTMFQAARVVGETVRELRRNEKELIEDSPSLFNASFILGGQIAGEPAAALPDLQGRQFHRGDEGHVLFPDRRAQIRQADPRPRRQAGHAHGGRRQAPPDLLRFHAPLQPVGRHADRSPRSTARTRWRSASSAASTRTIPISASISAGWSQAIRDAFAHIDDFGKENGTGSHHEMPETVAEIAD